MLFNLPAFSYHGLDVSLDGALLGRLTEAETARVTFVLNAVKENLIDWIKR
jgi:hypothetical protein